MIEEIKERAKNRELKISVVGLGYVGLPLAIEFAREGFEVTGIDVDEVKVKKIEMGESYIPDVPNSVLREVKSNGKLNATTSFDVLKDIDLIIIAVPTPLSKTKDPDMSYVVSAIGEVKKRLRKGHIIALESTTYPGTTVELVKPMLEETGFKAGEDFFLAFSPERIDPGNRVYGVKNTPKIVGGVTEKCTEVVSFIYSQVIEKIVPVSSATVAEMAKLLENTFRSVNIALANEMAIMCNILGVDVWEVIEAAGTKPFGFMKFYPGPGIGGHCIPIDPLYLSWKLKTLNYNAKFIDLASQINTSMPRYVVERVADALNEREKSIKGSKILVLGVAYKKDVNDTRESPAFDIIKLLEHKGAIVVFHDPYVDEIHLNGNTRKSVPLTPEVIREQDCVIIVTDHSNVDYELVVKEAKLVFDAKNATKGIKKSSNLIKL